MIESHAVVHEGRMRPAMRPEMNMLHLLRHAKSSAKEDVDDHQRPLSRRGRKTARRAPAPRAGAKATGSAAAAKPKARKKAAAAAAAPKPKKTASE